MRFENGPRTEYRSMTKGSPMTSKKLDHLREEQSRDLHPERDQVGSPQQQKAQAEAEAADALDPDHQPGGTGKVANDHNKAGDQHPTQKHESRRTPGSRHDRESQLGSDNQSRSRRGQTGGEHG